MQRRQLHSSGLANDSPGKAMSGAKWTMSGSESGAVPAMRTVTGGCFKGNIRRMCRAVSEPITERTGMLGPEIVDNAIEEVNRNIEARWQL